MSDCSFLATCFRSGGVQEEEDPVRRRGHGRDHQEDGRRGDLSRRRACDPVRRRRACDPAMLPTIRVGFCEHLPEDPREDYERPGRRRRKLRHAPLLTCCFLPCLCVVFFGVPSTLIDNYTILVSGVGVVPMGDLSIDFVPSIFLF